MTTKPGLFAELKRRNVLRGLYLAAAWLLAKIVTQILPVFDVSASWLRWVIVAQAVGFPLWIVFTWFYEIAPEGIKLEREVERLRHISQAPRARWRSIRQTWTCSAPPLASSRGSSSRPSAI